MSKIYYITITYKSILNKDNWRKGGHAITSFSTYNDGYMKINVEQYGESKEMAKEKLMNFLTKKGENKVVCVGSF